MTQTLDLSRFALDVNLDDKEFKESVYQKRLSLIDIAIKWQGATPKNHFIFHNVWRYPVEHSYVICFGKYGKEYYGSGTRNVNDMKPCVFKNGAVVDSFRGRFDDIFSLMEICGHKGLFQVVKAFAILFYRNALLLDHYIEDGEYVYEPPKELVDYICSQMPEYENIPMEVYIHALDAIGYNEDVKYYTLGKLQDKRGTGRENNMKTYAYAAACVLGFENWSGLLYSMMRGYGVAPLGHKKFAVYFPEANVQYREVAPRARRANSDVIVIEGIEEHSK